MRLSSFSRPLRRLQVIIPLIIAGHGCGDAGQLGPGLPGRGALAIAPQIAVSSPGGPVIQLAKVRALLVREGTDRPDTARADAAFDGDSAVLWFEVKVASPSQLFRLEVDALDGLGTLIFTGADTVSVAPGRNPARAAPRLAYVAPDTAVQFLILSPLDTVLDAGDSFKLSVLGLAADQSIVEPVYVGWTSREPLVATVSALGTVTAQALDGEAWIVAQTFTGATDSARVFVRTQALDIIPASARRDP